MSSCNIHNGMNLTGKLVYSGGSSEIKTVDLASLASATLYKSPHNVALIAHLTKVTPDLILFDECPVTESCVIKELNLSNGETKTLHTGQMPIYVAEHDCLFFYDRSEYQNDNALLMAKRNEIAARHKVANMPPPKRLPNGNLLPVATPAIQISQDEVVFVGEDHQLWIYRISESTLFPTEVKDCLPQVWRNQTQELLCYDWNSWELYAIDLQTKQKKVMSFLKRAHGLLYVPEDDLLIYGKSRLYFLISETSDIFAYSFATSERVKLRPHAHISSGILVKEGKWRRANNS